jgi:signal transduction histidine kinase
MPAMPKPVTMETPRVRDLENLSLPAFVLDDTGLLEWVNSAFAVLIPGWKATRRPAFIDLVFQEISAIASEPEAPRTFLREIVITDLEGAKREHLLTLDAQPGVRPTWVGILTEISHIRRTERDSQQHLRVEMLLSSISGRFVGAYDTRTSIEATLSDLAEFTESDRAFVLVLEEDGAAYADTYEWCAPGLAPSVRNLEGQPVTRMSWWHDEVTRNEVLDIPDIAACPADARQELMSLGVTAHGSMLIGPITVGDRLAGAVGFLSRRPRAHCDLTEMFILDIVCQTLERVILMHRKDMALQASVRELKLKQAQLIQSEKMASIGQIAAGVAHEINNPIGFVMGNISALQSYATTIRGSLTVCAGLIDGGAADPDALASLDRGEVAYIADDLDGILTESLEGCVRVRDIVENLKGFARMEQSHPRPTDLNACVESTLKIVWNELKYRCQVVKDLQELPPLNCYGGQINQVIMNLLVNAAHAIKTEGTVTVRTRVVDEEIVLSVTDTGVGIPPENIPRLFDPFFTTKEPGKGTGLGLYVCHGIVERHQGHFVVDSVVGQGTTMTVHLPLTGIPDGGPDA